jgi:hypothetical protein
VFSLDVTDADYHSLGAGRRAVRTLRWLALGVAATTAS